MTLIKSISGIRGTLGGKPGDTLSPVDVVKFAAAYGIWLKENSENHKVVIGRDARPSGEMITKLAASTLQSLGIDVVDLELSTTPTVEMAVVMEEAGGGIVITASHNPIQWNALKLLNHKGEFISAADGEKILEIADAEDFEFVETKKLGDYSVNREYIQKHIEAILELPLVDKAAIEARNFRIALDCVNSTGGIAVPMLLHSLGVKEVKGLYCEPNGLFPHNPEPIPENLRDISREVENGDYDLGIVVDPDVDRLALVCEDGSMFGEEYTLVAISDYILSHNPGATVSNLSSTKALKELTEKVGQEYHTSAVGEVNVVTKMKEVDAVIGGEGNGGIIYPDLHHGRDALVGIALFLTHLAKSEKPVSMLRAKYPKYQISKNKISLTPEIDTSAILNDIQEKYKAHDVITIDGVKIEFESSWVHLRKSNTEPIIRIYAEAASMSTADNLANKIIDDIREIVTAKDNS
ncbi:phosphoglucosamine mutase [uncultured Microscilla sp.]|uniref:phosphoglucosamine mutase n=1 Tax=uncultured Microscilla sp. TaxID=432653 RepID=UPI0026347594|nr:phosphoglucosamine mutase [uncultured Microscilla sp.]